MRDWNLRQFTAREWVIAVRLCNQTTTIRSKLHRCVGCVSSDAPAGLCFILLEEEDPVDLVKELSSWGSHSFEIRCLEPDPPCWLLEGA
jgi:hypothetical protein